MNDLTWRKATLDQLAKDFNMAGTDLPYFQGGENLEKIIHKLGSEIAKLRESPELWNNLNYRIDIPVNLLVEVKLNNEFAELYLFRSFQKVWLRRQFSANSSKDDEEANEKHLKP
ncbi:MAG: hypothetical protein WEC59_00080 [Salibacteraceae bacterium]